VDDQKSILTIETKRGIMLNFEIGPLYIELVENEISCLEDLAGHKLTPGYLF
jgi:hypothetical protein